MNRKLIPVFGHPNLWRDPQTNAILNKDPAKRQVKEKLEILDNKYNKIEEEVSNIQNSINELKNLLLNYLNKENKN
jgi:hypothetical protein